MKTLISVLMGFTFSLFFVLLLGANPFEVATVLARSSVGSLNNFLGTLSYSTPLIFTGLSVVIAFHSGLFNIGGEGQLYMGSLFLTTFSLFFPHCPWPLSIFSAIVFAALGGGIWGALAGWLKARRGSHEVIVTIMLNFISYSICSYFILTLIKNPLSQNPESAELNASYFLKPFTEQTSLNPAFLIALLACVILWFALFKTSWGYEVRLIGAQIETAKRSGIPIARRLMQTMFISGSLSGLVALHEILGNSHKFKDQYSPGYGFIGIAVAILAKNNPLAVIFSALLFGALAKGSLDLELDTEKVTRDMAMLVQGLIILFLSAKVFWSSRRGHKLAG